jgi:hypothetical protein
MGLQETVLRKQILGEQHPSTLMTMANLAVTYSKLGNWDKAMEPQETVLELRNQVLGEQHPDTLLVMENLLFHLTEFVEVANS